MFIIFRSTVNVSWLISSAILFNCWSIMWILVNMLFNTSSMDPIHLVKKLQLTLFWLSLIDLIVLNVWYKCLNDQPLREIQFWKLRINGVAAMRSSLSKRVNLSTETIWFSSLWLKPDFCSSIVQSFSLPLSLFFVTFASLVID